MEISTRIIVIAFCYIYPVTPILTYLFILITRQQLLHESLCQQEYSSRQVGITSGIIIACIIPIILLIVFVAVRFFKKQKMEREQEAELSRARTAELHRLRKLKEEEEPAPYTSQTTEIN